MATVVNRDMSEPDKPKLTITIDNGDLVGLDKAIKEWDFKDEESLLKFCIAVLVSSTQGKLFTTDENGKKVGLSPADHLLNNPQTDSTIGDTNAPSQSSTE